AFCFESISQCREFTHRHRRRQQTASEGLEPLCRGTGKEGWSADSQAGRAGVTLSLHHQSDCRVCTGARTKESPPADRRAGTGAGGAALVLLFPAQSARVMVKSSASAKGKSENHGHRRSLVLELMTPFGFHY